MPDPLRFGDGTRVATPSDWDRRRLEMEALVLRLEYGHPPPPPGNVESTRVSESAMDGCSVRHRHDQLRFGPDHALRLELHSYLPGDRCGPFPVLVRIGLGDEMAPEITRRGYALVAFDHRELGPEAEGRRVVGPAQQAYPEHDWASITVWAWGASRVADHLATCGWAHPQQLMVTGHSRTGKAALLAGALDERFAMVIPNGSGAGGAGAFRIMGEGSETLELITRAERWAGWFHPDFRRFAGHESHLPFDQHFLRALVAPRLVLTTDAHGDAWANPLGTRAGFHAAQPVFDFLGVSDHNAMHFRPGDHDQLLEDFRVLLDYADWHFRGEALRHSRTS